MSAEPVDLIVEHATELLTCAAAPQGARAESLDELGIVPDGAVAVRAGRIVAAGTSEEIGARYEAARRIDASGQLVSPGLVDPHSHLVYAGSRHDEWEHRVTGRPLTGGLQGGIHRNVAWTRAADPEALTRQALADLDTMLLHGTTVVEAKTGYGLERAAELRLLRLTAGLRHTVEVVPTFCGAHVPPVEHEHDVDGYVDIVVDMLPEVARLAEYCDVCCDPIGFDRAQCRRIGTVARELGLGIRVHSDQTGDAGGGVLAAELGAASADHGDYTSDEGFRAMARAGTVVVLLPGVTSHMLEMTPSLGPEGLGTAEKPFMPEVARRAIDAGCIVALSTDYNPGSCPTPSMQMVMQLAARLFRLGYAQIWNMCTVNAAVSLGRAAECGSLAPGKRADIVLWSVPEHGMVINRFGYNMVHSVLAAGELVVHDGRVLHPATRAA